MKREVRVKESFKKKLVRSRLKWAGHVERMRDEKLAKRAYIPEKWREKETRETENAMDDCVNRDLERVEEELRTKPKHSRNWGLVIENALGERSGEERIYGEKSTVTMANITLDVRDNNDAVIYDYDNDRFDKSEKCCLDIEITINMNCYLRGKTVGATH